MSNVCVRCAAVAAMVIAVGACFSGTTVPGVRRCVRVFFVIGYYTECEEGPPWNGVQVPPPPPPPAPIVRTPEPAREPTTAPTRSPAPTGPFCFYAIPDVGKHAVETCFDAIEECRRVQGTVRPPAQVTIECEPKAR